ncbi:hypothetical protein M3Y97_00084500 [Aphelenchoides bicaudatus]|nr:hypothetical protein M3Y97_00084500 [Aphelenchoides bicaudatus]
MNLNSSDSLNNEMSQNFRMPDSQQMMDPNDVARGSSFAPQILSSPAVARREFVPHQSGYISTVPQPQHGKMLIDPQTGQQYFVATNTQPQQVAYYPVFYNTAAPPPAPMQQHVYYAPAHQPQWIGSAIPNSPAANSHQPNFFNHPYAPSTTISGHNIFLYSRLSRRISVCDERGNSPSNVYFQRHHESRMSTESANSGNNQHFQAAPLHSDDSMSPIPPQSIPRNASSSNQSAMATAANNQTKLMENSARYSTASSSATSGFVSGTGESTTDNSSNRPNALSNLRTTFKKSNLYGAPEWWGEESSPEMERSNKKVENDRTPTQTQKKLDSPTSSAPKTVVEKPEAQAEPRVVAKPIRMEIDLSQPFSPENKTPATNEQKGANRVPPTAFTIDFGDNETNSARRTKPPVLTSQQEGGSSRRSARNSMPPNQVQLPQSNSSQQDPKHYLFTKMIQGFPATSATDEDDQHTAILSLGGDRRNDIDAISEAGTYTIDDKNKFRHQNRSRQFSDASSTSSASSSTATNKSTSRQQPSTARSNTTKADGSSALNSARSTSNSIASPHFAMRRSLMRDLRELKNQQQSIKPANGQQQPKARTMAVDPLKSSRLCTPASNQRAAPVASPRTSVTNQSAGFRRSDGGRFSMRTGGAPMPNTRSANNKPPFRAGIAPPTKKTQINSGTPEMENWLKRKSYNPRKSVAEERKMQQLKERSDTFFANRSVSYNQPASYSGFRKLLKPIDDERSNVSQSQDDLSRLREEEDEEFGGSSSNLTKTVDELTKKCQRSMQLLKLCNSNALTESVEHLLDQIVDEEGSENGDSAIGRLERLNEAFGALQKCLEDNTSSSRTSSPRNMSDAIKQRILSPTSSAPAFESPEEF